MQSAIHLDPRLLRMNLMFTTNQHHHLLHNRIPPKPTRSMSMCRTMICLLSPNLELHLEFVSLDHNRSISISGRRYRPSRLASTKTMVSPLISQKQDPTQATWYPYDSLRISVVTFNYLAFPFHPSNMVPYDTRSHPSSPPSTLAISLKGPIQ